MRVHENLRNQLIQKKQLFEQKIDALNQQIDAHTLRTQQESALKSQVLNQTFPYFLNHQGKKIQACVQKRFELEQALDEIMSHLIYTVEEMKKCDLMIHKYEKAEEVKRARVEQDMLDEAGLRLFR